MPGITVLSLVDAIGAPEGVAATFTAEMFSRVAAFTYRPAVRVSGATVTFPTRVVADLTGDSSVVELSAPDADCWWRIVVSDGTRSLVRDVEFPVGVGPFDFGDLVDIDPETFAPLTPMPPNVQDILDAAAAARDVAVESAEAAAGAAAAAVEAADTGGILGSAPGDFLSPAEANAAYGSPEGKALRVALNSGNAVVLLVQGDSTGNATNEWVYLTTQAIAAAYPDCRVIHRLWNDTVLAYDTPTVVQAATEAYLTPSTSDFIALSDTGAAAITGDLTIRAKVRSTDLDAASERTIAAKFGGTSAERSWRFYIDASNGLTLSWLIDGTGTARTHAVASHAQIAAVLSDNTDGYLGVQLDVNNGAGQYTVTALTSVDGVTWTSFGTPATGSTGTTTINVSTGPLRVGARGIGAGGSAAFNGRIYWAEICSGIGANAKIVARMDPGLSTRLSAWTGTDGLVWNNTGSGLTRGSQMVVMLNASHPGADADYSLSNFAAQAPLAPDLAILNYAHNGPTASSEIDYAGVEFAPLLDEWAAEWPTAPLLVTAQNEQISPRTAAQIEDQARRVRGVARLAASRRLNVIDVFDAIGADPAAYIDTDGIHPNASGSLVWAATVATALAPAL